METKKIDGEFEANYEKNKKAAKRIIKLLFVFILSAASFCWTMAAGSEWVTLTQLIMFLVSVAIGAVGIEYMSSGQIIYNPYYASALAQKERKKRKLGQPVFPKEP